MERSRSSDLGSVSRLMLQSGVKPAGAAAVPGRTSWWDGTDGSRRHSLLETAGARTGPGATPTREGCCCHRTVSEGSCCRRTGEAPPLRGQDSRHRHRPLRGRRPPLSHRAPCYRRGMSVPARCCCRCSSSFRWVLSAEVRERSEYRAQTYVRVCVPGQCRGDVCIPCAGTRAACV